MANLSHFRPYIVPVVAHTKQRAIIKTVPRPDVGVRWGKPSKFEFEELEKEPERDQPPIAWPDRTLVFEGDEVWRKFEKVQWGGTQEVERISEILFFMGTTEHKTEETFEHGNIQPIVEHRHNYLQFKFTLNEHGTVVSSGERGEYPETEIPLPPPTWAERIEMIYRGIRNRPWLKGG